MSPYRGTRYKCRGQNEYIKADECSLASPSVNKREFRPLSHFPSLAFWIFDPVVDGLRLLWGNRYKSNVWWVKADGMPLSTKPMPQLLNLCSESEELQLLKPTYLGAHGLHNKRSHCKWAVCTPQLETALPAATKQKAWGSEIRSQHSKKISKKLFFYFRWKIRK